MMHTLWEQVRALEGQTLSTARGRAFDVSMVDDRQIHVVPHSTGKVRPIRRHEFERAETLGLVTLDITPIRLRQAGVSEVNPAYVAAIIREIVQDRQ